MQSKNAMTGGKEALSASQFWDLVEALPRDQEYPRKYFLYLQDYQPRYRETSHWTPVIIPYENDQLAGTWLIENGHLRGTHINRNDWLHPIDELYLIRDPNTALMFKLAVGGSI